MIVDGAVASMTLARVVWGHALSLPAESRESVVTIGTFDGVHRGHRRLLNEAVEQAQQLDMQAVAVTWDRHPKSAIANGVAPPLVTTMRRKVELLAESGVDVVVVLQLDRASMLWSPVRFVDEIFVNTLQARSIVVGSDWRFGYKAGGNVTLLAKLGETRAFTVTSVEREGASADPASSTAVRHALALGDLEVAEQLLGRLPEVEGQCCEATASSGLLDVLRGLACPPIGRYSARSRIGGTWVDCTAVVRSDHRIQVEYSAHAGAMDVGGHIALQFLRPSSPFS